MARRIVAELAQNEIDRTYFCAEPGNWFKNEVFFIFTLKNDNIKIPNFSVLFAAQFMTQLLLPNVSAFTYTVK